MTTTDYQTLIYEYADSVAWIHLNRPERRNAFSEEMYHEFIDAARRVELDDAVRVVAITGVGAAFCAGGDIKSMQDRLVDAKPSPASRQWRYWDLTTRVVQTLFGISKPVVSVVNGPAVGGGACLALLSDIRIAADSSWLSFPFVARGLLPDWGATYLLPRAVGPSLGFELLLSQRRISAVQAEQWGIFSSIHPPEELESQANAVLASIAALPPNPIQALKRKLRQPEVGQLVAAMREEGAYQSGLTSDPDFAQAISAFLNKSKQ